MGGSHESLSARRRRWRTAERLRRHVVGGAVGAFPPDSLLRLGYAPNRFRAYRELGRLLSAERLVPVLLAEPG